MRGTYGSDPGHRRHRTVRLPGRARPRRCAAPRARGATRDRRRGDRRSRRSTATSARAARGGTMLDDAVTMAEYLRIKHRYIDGTMTGGSSFEFHVQHARRGDPRGAVRHDPRHLRLRPADPHGSHARHRRASSGPGRRCRVRCSTRPPYGNSLVGSYAMHATRHMHEFGTTSEQLAEIAVGVREFASLNPNAMYRDPITVDDVVDSRMIADPLHKLDCCAITDGGGAFIMTTAERAKRPRAAAGLRARRRRRRRRTGTSRQQTDFTSSRGCAGGTRGARPARASPTTTSTC